MNIVKNILYLCAIYALYNMYSQIKNIPLFIVTSIITIFVVWCHVIYSVANYENKEIFIIDANGVIQEKKQIVVRKRNNSYV